MEYFAITTEDGAVIREPFPLDLPLDEREAYMAARLAALAVDPDSPSED